ncbi:MAG: hypothetical protein ABR510_07595 [Trueperaceae bacterium]
MNARTLRLALAAIAAIALATAAWAQDQDAYLQRYGIAVDGLRNAVATVADDPITAREGIDRAFNALLTLSRDAAGTTLVGAMERVFERARTAIANGSADDLAVQAAVLEGGFQRLAYESALSAALAGDLPRARARLARVASDIGFAESDRAAFADVSQSASVLRFQVETGVAAVMTTRLAVARELAATNPGGAYRSLARAYGHFLLVQDSPRAAGTLNQGFVDAASALVADDPAGVIDALEQVEADIAALGVAARERRASVPGAAVVGEAQPSLLPSVETDAEDAAVRAPDGEVADVDATEADAAVADDGAPGTITEAELTALLLAREEAARRERLDRLEADLAIAGMAPASRAAHAERLLDAGFETFDAALGALESAAARVVAATHRGADADAHEALDDMVEAYAALVAPVLQPRDGALDADTNGLFDHLAEAHPLRVQDAVVLAGQIEAVRQATAGDVPSAIQRGARTTTSVWAGLPRDVLTLLIGLLALIPLVLLNVAFGGGNRHWQAIGVALLLLLVPALYEGVVGLGGVLAVFAGVDALLPLAAFSVFSSAAAQTVWATTTLLAVAFATAGLIGISRQFGLLGGRRGRGGTGRASSGSTKATSATAGTAGTAATVDWDDEL